MDSKVIIKQHDIKDCGAASLLSIIRYYDGYVPINKIRNDACITKDGITAYNLILAAKKYGFDAFGIKISDKELLNNNVLLPCIAYLELKNGLKHYVVIYAINKKNFLIMDPAHGKIKMSINEFLEVFKNVLIVLSPRYEIVKYEENNKLYDIFINIIKKDKKIFITLLLTSILLTVFSVLSSFYMKLAINSVLNKSDGVFIIIVSFFAFITIMKIIMSFLQEYYANYLNKNINTKILLPFIRHIFNLPLSAISNHTTGEITTRINEINNIKDLFSDILVNVIMNLLLAFCSCIVLLIINFKLFLLLLFVLLFYFIFNLFWIKPINKYVDKNINYETDLNSSLVSYINGIISIKTSNNFKYFDTKIDDVLYKYLNGSFRFNHFINVYTFFNNFIIEVGLFTINTYGLYLIMNNKLAFIDLVTFDSLYLYLIDPIKQIINIFPRYFYIKKTFTKINEFISLEEEKHDSHNKQFTNGDIIFSNVSYSYDFYNYPLKNLNLEIKEGNKVLIMGKSGCGKSTLFKLLFRIINPNNGKICINNINILDYDLDVLRNNITYVSQDEKLFNGTIKENITLNGNISIKYLNEVIKLCQVDDILDKRKMRLDSYIIEEGNNFSGGEKARIILARALLRKTKIILLDEIFSEIEKNDANAIINNINDFYKNKTIIIISHFKPKYKFDKEINL